MSCQWGHNDCQNAGAKCTLCLSEGFHYVPPKIKKQPQLNKRQQKADKRMGSSFEYKNHQKVKQTLESATTRMTPNSGAGKVKGDESIRGLVKIMEELKTKVVQQAPGKESFTIKKEWLHKLNREANAANEEFYYLKFSFHEYDPDVYVITEQEIIMDMVATIVNDRRAAQQAKLDQEIAERRSKLKEAENIKLQTEIDYLKSLLKKEPQK